MNIIVKILNALPLNGSKMNTGTIIAISAIVLQQVLGIGESEAGAMATNIAAGIGAVIALVGYVHRIIKKKSAAGK
jgi:energy-converting hydrogenase Eha subunit C